MTDEISQNKRVPYAAAIIKLLQGIIYDDDSKPWNDLLNHQKQVRDYFRQIGIHLHIDETEGFAFLTQPDTDDAKVPRLVRRMPLSYEVTLLLIILRESLEEFDVRTADSSKCFVTYQELIEKTELLFKEKADKVKLLSKFDTYINQAVSLGFLKPMDTNETGDPQDRRYEIRRAIKAKITNEKLEEFREQLEKK